MLKPEPVPPASEAPVSEAPSEAWLRFGEFARANKPIATMGLSAVLAAIFGLQLFVGEGDSTGAYELSRLGALVPSRVLAGEWWRVIGWSFLHIGFLHILMNSYALWAIGRGLERVLGSWRFITIYTAAVLLGAVVVMTTSEAQLTAGASGGIFGLLGAEAVLVLSPRSPLPVELRVQRRSAILMNLAFNMYYSFRPGVSASGHAGGFLAGALVALFLPTTLEGLVDGAKRPLSRGLGVLSVVILAVGLVASLAPALPVLFSNGPIALAPQSLPGLGLRADLPVELGAVAVVDANSVTVGDVMLNRGGVALVRIPNTEPMSADAMDAELSALLAQYQSEEARAALVPEGTIFQEATRTELAGRPALRARFTAGEAGSGLVQDVVFRPLGDAFMRIDVVYWARFSGAYADAAERIAASIE